MSFSVGIVGLPNVGKSTTFNALLKRKQAAASNFPFCTIDPNVGVVNIPDERLEQLAQVSRSKKIVPTAIEFIDIAGLVKDAHKGEGLGNKFLSHIREVDAIIEVVRAFQNPEIIHVAGKISPADDIATVNLELIMADLQTVAKRLSKVASDAKSVDPKSSDGAGKALLAEKKVLEKIKQALEREQAVRDMQLSKEEMALVKSLSLLTAKPLLYVVNVDEKTSTPTELPPQHIMINAQLESEIAELPEEEQENYKKELGVTETGLDKLIKESYQLLNLITFLTSGEPETRAWTVTRGALTPEGRAMAAWPLHPRYSRMMVEGGRQGCAFESCGQGRRRSVARHEGQTHRHGLPRSHGGCVGG